MESFEAGGVRGQKVLTQPSVKPVGGYGYFVSVCTIRLFLGINLGAYHSMSFLRMRSGQV